MQKIDLLNGRITPTLARLAFPIMGTSLMQMAYNMIDMIWIGRVSADAVAAVGAAGMYLWLAQGLATIPRLGAQVKVAHAIGAGDAPLAARYAQTAFHMGAVLMAFFTAVCLIFHVPLIAFFKLNSAAVTQDAQLYLIVVASGFLFTFCTQIFTGLFTAMGNSSIVFRSTAVGLVANMILDPLMIFGFGPFPRMNVAGAALATVLAQAAVSVMFLLAALRESHLFPYVHLFSRSHWQDWRAVAKIGLPVSLQSMFFSSLSMIIARLIAGWGDAAIAAQKVGTQIESISYMTADGFATAVNAFLAQNYGANKPERIRKGYWTAMRLMIVWSIFTTVILIVFPEPLCRIFISEPDVVEIGVSYLRIMGYSQILMSLEITSSGAFQGLGHPVPPAVSGIVGNLLRVPMAIVLSATVLGLDGVWWSISISSILKGIVVFGWFIFTLQRYLSRSRQTKREE